MNEQVKNWESFIKNSMAFIFGMKEPKDKITVQVEEEDDVINFQVEVQLPETISTKIKQALKGEIKLPVEFGHGGRKIILEELEME